MARAIIEGELHLTLSVHKSGFVEVDFVDPALIDGGVENEHGIIFHSRKQTLPLFYLLKDEDLGIAQQGLGKCHPLVKSRFQAYSKSPAVTWTPSLQRTSSRR